MAALAGAIVALASTPILFRLSELGPTATAFHRTFLAVPLLALWAAGARWSGARAASVLRADKGLVVAAGALFAFNILAYTWALQLTSVASASLLANLSPLFVTVGLAVIGAGWPRPRFFVCLATAMAGALVVMTERNSDVSISLFGDALALVSAIFFAAYLIVSTKLRTRLAVVQVMLWTAGTGAALLLLAAIGAGETLVPTTLRGWVILLALGWFSYLLGQGLLIFSLAGVGGPFAAASTLMLPVVSATLAAVVLGEPLSGNQIVGGLITLASLFGARTASGSAPPPKGGAGGGT